MPVSVLIMLRLRTALDGWVDVRLKIDNATGQAWQGTLRLVVAGENHDGPGAELVMPLALSAGINEIDAQLDVPEPQWWWPWDHGDPNLYQLQATLEDAGRQVVDRHSEIFGIRTVQLERSPDRFTYVVNDCEIYLRGTSYMPALYQSQCSREGLAQDIDLAREANLNLLRVHVHVSPPDVYDLCDRQGMLIWQDFELNWIQESSAAFEVRARRLQREMIDLLGNHPSIMTWTCHNEPSMVLTRRQNYEVSPGPALYADACQQDPTRPVFICSGQMEDDWTRSGDAHVYFGGLWSPRYADVYRHHYRVCSEFGFEAPAAIETLQAAPDVWARLDHLEGKIDDLWQYQAEFIQFYVEHLRRQRATGGGGYVHFWLADLVPQIGCGVLDARRNRKGGYDALARASQPLHVALEHDGRRSIALWVFNDTTDGYEAAVVEWSLYDAKDTLLVNESIAVDVAANQSQRLTAVQWPATCDRIELVMREAQGNILTENSYQRPFQPTPRPAGYPWKFDPYLGTKVFDRPGAASLAEQGENWLVKLVPLALRERGVEWVLRQRFPLWLASAIARVADRVNS